MSKLFTSTEAGRILGGSKPIPLSTLAYWRRTRQGPSFIKVGRSYRYSEAALLHFLESNTKNVGA